MGVVGCFGLVGRGSVCFLCWFGSWIVVLFYWVVCLVEKVCYLFVFE